MSTDEAYLVFLPPGRMKFSSGARAFEYSSIHSSSSSKMKIQVLGTEFAPWPKKVLRIK
jgi:hypothetical protein